jgi:hypothetical protein
MGTLSLGAKNAVEVCMGVKPGEHVLIVTDKGTYPVGNALKAAAERITNFVDMHVLEDYGTRPMMSLPKRALIKDKNAFRLFWAPSDSGQFIATSTSTNPMNPSSWSTPVKLTTANNWWDFWPRPYKKDNLIYLFYTSERNSDGTARTDGNIWMSKLD